jgi:hypothetical protein
MKFIIWHKFIYLLLIAANLVVVLSEIFGAGDRIADSLNAYVLSYFSPVLFFAVHLLLLTKLLNKNISESLYRLDQILSFGRMTMSGLIGFAGLLAYLTILAASPVAHSLWKWLAIYSQNLNFVGMGFLAICCSFLMVNEIIYISFLRKNKNNLTPATNAQGKQGPVFSKISELSKFAFQFWQTKTFVYFGMLYFVCSAVVGVNVWSNVLNPPETTKTIELFEKVNREKGKTYLLEIPNGYFDNGNAITSTNSIGLKASYSGNPDSLQKINFGFYSKEALKTGRIVKIHISNNSSKDPLNQNTSYPNDIGRYALDYTLKHPDLYIQSSMSVSIGESEKIVKYKTIPRGEGFTNPDKYVVTHEDKRISMLSCYANNTCEGRTTWKGQLAISYTRKNMDLKTMVDFDRSVVALVDSFKPEIKN